MLNRCSRSCGLQSGGSLPELTMKGIMKKALRIVDSLLWVLLLVSALLPALMYAGNDVMGEIQFEGKSHVEKTSGVWVDGAYVGYLKELKGSKKVLLPTR